MSVSESMKQFSVIKPKFNNPTQMQSSKNHYFMSNQVHNIAHRHKMYDRVQRKPRLKLLVMYLVGESVNK